MNARKGNITVEPYTRSVRTVQREGRKSLNFPSTLLSISLIMLSNAKYIKYSFLIGHDGYDWYMDFILNPTQKTARITP